MSQLTDARGLTEEQAIARFRSRNYPKPAMTADLVILKKEREGRSVLLIRRAGHPFLGKWALPGGFANEREPVEQTAARELREETGVEGVTLELVDVFSQPDRDPRGWVVSVAYLGQIPRDQSVKAGDDAAEACWFALDGERLRGKDLCLSFEDLAFDHGEILRRAIMSKL